METSDPCEVASGESTGCGDDDSLATFLGEIILVLVALSLAFAACRHLKHHQTRRAVHDTSSQHTREAAMNATDDFDLELNDAALAASVYDAYDAPGSRASRFSKDDSSAFDMST